MNDLPTYTSCVYLGAAPTFPRPDLSLGGPLDEKVEYQLATGAGASVVTAAAAAAAAIDPPRAIPAG